MLDPMHNTALLMYSALPTMKLGGPGLDSLGARLEAERNPKKLKQSHPCFQNHVSPRHPGIFQICMVFLGFLGFPEVSAMFFSYILRFFEFFWYMASEGWQCFVCAALEIDRHAIPVCLCGKHALG